MREGQGPVLVTGADGFTGRFLVERLRASGHRVIGLARDAGSLSDREVVDLRDKDGVRRIVRNVRPHQVVHLAARSFVGDADIEAFYQVNVLGTENLLEAVSDLPTPPHVLLASSANVYGNAAFSEEPLDESVCPQPVNHYAISKLAMEHMAGAWRERLPVTIVRPFNYTGPGQAERFLVPKIVSHLTRREKTIHLGNIEVARDLLDVRDVVAAYEALMMTPAAVGNVFNVCSGRPITLRRIVAMATEAAGRSIDIEVDSRLIRSNEIRWLEGDASRLRSLTGWRPTVSFQQTLADMVSHASVGRS